MKKEINLRIHTGLMDRLKILWIIWENYKEYEINFYWINKYPKWHPQQRYIGEDLLEYFTINNSINYKTGAFQFRKDYKDNVSNIDDFLGFLKDKEIKPNFYDLNLKNILTPNENTFKSSTLYKNVIYLRCYDPDVRQDDSIYKKYQFFLNKAEELYNNDTLVICADKNVYTKLIIKHDSVSTDHQNTSLVDTIKDLSLIYNCENLILPKDLKNGAFWKIATQFNENINVIYL